jgi:hypothetical protein
MAAISTTNALTDFDMCLALAQTSIDTQMKYAWKAWTRRTQRQDLQDQSFQATINIFKLKQRSGNIVDSPYGLSARLAPLTVSLNVPDGKMGQVKVNLLLESGKVVYFDEEDGAKAEYPIDKWKVSFITDLDKKPVDLQALGQIDPAAHKTAKDLIESAHLPESVFSIEYLFLKLTKVDLMLAGNKDVTIPENVPASARSKALSTLNLLLQGELGEYSLGTVVRRTNPRETQTQVATPTFALTDFIFDVHANQSVASASTLSYLGQFARRELPPDTSAARLKMRDAWVRPEQLDGTEANVSGIMAIGKDVFLEKYLIPKVKAALHDFSFPPPFPAGPGYGRPDGYEGPEAKRDRLTWTFEDGVKGGVEEPDIVGGKRKYTIDQGYELALTVQPSSNQVSIKGRLWTNANFDGYAPIVQEPAEWVRVHGHQDISGTLSLVDNSIGAAFNLESHLEYTIGAPVVDKEERSTWAEVAAFFDSAFKTLGISVESPSELIREAQKGVGQKLKSVLQESLARLDMDLRQHTFIPPGGGVFTFRNPRFSTAGDLFFEVIYRAP